MIPKVKVCGIRRLEDAMLAAELGASAVGFVLWAGSPRAVTANIVREIARRLPPFVTPVGVFVNQPREEVLELGAQAGVGVIQLHGDEDASGYAGCPFRVIKALSVGPEFTMAAVDGVPQDVTVLLDAHDPVRRGGTGRTIEWSVAREAAARRRIVLSGGLSPANIQSAIRTVQPYGVDVSSGVEQEPGVKDAAKLRAFFAALHAVEVS